ncbi:MAG TPA: DNA-3-methyladenine glycosylase 2 family protein [Mycobacteriales bacterium]|nr:DNA-3-methyladenine glycosylase 2 family protein [Mycobacteriales bacterium]
MTAVEERAVETVWRAGRPVDVHGTLRPFLRGRSDRAHRLLDGVFWRCALTPAGPVTLALRQGAREEVRASAWGPGAEWTIASIPELLGARDSCDDFVPRHRVLSDTHRKYPGVRIPRSGLVMDSVIPAILEQRVTSKQAHEAWKFLLVKYGTVPPGPAPDGMRVPPHPAVLLTVPTWDWHRAGVDITRQRAVRAAATVAHRLEECVGMAPADALARLRVVPGLGVWTAAETAQRALGDADAVSVGDFHIPGLVGHALIGRRVDDDGMLELLAEWPGHRHRVVRLIELAGIGKPRYGPRFAPQDYRDF